ncbi:MAG: hypothetical protein AB8A49_01345 [Prochlorococcus sp.]|jgi:hypothetical protein|nr:hypothetical protein [Prochlorococcaceae cyanobacterium ETNP18_MAG_17]MDP6320725.1 hypothetical protein [Prochlorococcaceae cyanobacterium ETNP14_MAG_5]MDP6851760.1 hypothetical protein [Prochlorococcaceae cyanobacterium ETNP1_MAG_8]MDP7327606.1 hypothetical protein [Prochlorococcaceae cyanobacterium ETNP7_MAG_30]HJL68785.1 hypothetical protein [Prochlorococcaceae cyanobacterium Gl_MAG_24]|tara:strand:+ start:1083 stop:1289 length:207 start_codon:yes stop_codon:yes gene_type:complete
MSDATPEELQQTIEDIKSYRDRLRNEIISIGKKLRMPQKKIDASLADHAELQQIEGILAQLVSQYAQE